MDDIKKSLGSISSDLKEINKNIREIDLTLVKQEQQLAEHIRRTNLLEEKMKPLESHVNHMQAGFKLLAFGSLIIGIFAGLSRLL